MHGSAALHPKRRQTIALLEAARRLLYCKSNHKVSRQFVHTYSHVDNEGSAIEAVTCVKTLTAQSPLDFVGKGSDMRGLRMRSAHVVR